MLSGRINGDDLQRDAADIEELMLRPSRNNHNIASLDILLLSTDDRTGIAMREEQDLVNGVFLLHSATLILISDR
jgi:hypothetical protein